jgi:ABC-type branched-subunit amino acid transport system substrate-binding protein
MRNQRRLRTAAVLTAFVFAGFGACGRSDNNSSGGGGGTGNTGGAVDASSKTGIGFDGKTIKVGILTPQSGVAKPFGDLITAGNEVYWNKVNAGGGVAGKYKIELSKADTKYTASEAITLYGQLKGEVAVFGQILGTPIVDSLKEQLKGDEILAQPATLDAFWVHEPGLLPFGAPYQIQAINGLDYAVRNLDAKNKNVCALTKDDAFGQAGLDYATDKLGVRAAGKATFKQGDDPTAAINTLQGANCDIVMLTALFPEVGNIAGAAATRQFAPKWIGLSPTWDVSLAVGTGGPTPLADYFQKNFLLAAEGVNWGDESVPGMKQMLDDIKTYKPDQTPNGYFAFGYNEAWALHQVLEFAAKQGDLTQKGIFDASHKIDKLTFGGGYGDYKYGEPSQREPSRQTTIFKIDATKPNATEAVEKNFISAAAKGYTFP